MKQMINMVDEKTYLEHVYNVIRSRSTKDLYNDRFAKFLHKLKPDGKSILDMGCGFGYVLGAFKRIGFRCVGVDLDDHGLDVCSKKGLEVHKVDLSKDKIPDDSKFDIIFSSHVIEHFSSPVNFVREAKRLLADDGILVILTPSWKYAYKRFYNDWTHVHPYTLTSLINLLEQFGFKIIKKHELFGLPFVWRWTGLAFKFHVKPELFVVCKHK